MAEIPSLLLAVDVGNTATNFGVYSSAAQKNPRCLDSWVLSTKYLSSVDSRLKIQKELRKFKQKFIGIIVSSVVPKVDRPLARALKSILKLDPWFVSGKTIPTVPIRLYHPQEVGADRLVNARASAVLGYRPSIIVDFGTATTFDCVSRDGAYLGGAIAPGPAISAQALYERTAKLPFVKLEHPARVLGRSTLQSIQSGLYHGYRGLVKEIVALLKKNLGPNTKVLSTGGQAKWILGGLDIIDRHIPELTLWGLVFLWHDRQNLRHKKGVRK